MYARLRVHRRADIDRLFSGRMPRDRKLASLSPLVHALRRTADSTPSETATMSVARQASAMNFASRSTLHARRLPAESARFRFATLTPRLAGAVVVLFVMISASAGVAFAADRAVPGSPLYELDLALEDFGLGAGGLGERLAESSRLLARGDSGLAFTTAAEALMLYAPQDDDVRQAADALRRAAEGSSGDAVRQSGELKAQLVETLSFMAASDFDSQEFGQAASALARDLSIDSHMGADDSFGPAGDGGNGGSDTIQEDSINKPDKGSTDTTKAKPH